MVSNLLQTSTRLLETSTVFIKHGFHIFNTFNLLDNTNTALNLRKAFEELGGVYIKLGQFVASTPNIFPKEYTDEMKKCLDSLEPIPYKKIHKILKQELGSSLKTNIASIDEKPLASASIAQVHSAKLTTGESIVLKIQKPDVQKIMEVDLNLIYVLSWLLENLLPSIAKKSLTNLITDFYRIALDEIDFIKEVENISIFQEYLDNIQIQNVVVPYVYKNLSTSKVIVMEKLEGISLKDLNQVQTKIENSQELILLSLDVWLRSLTESPIFHADVHAGNVLILHNKKIAFIDFGIVGTLSTNTWQHIMLLFQALNERNYDTIAKILVELDATQNENIDLNQLSKDLKNLFEQVKGLEPSILAEDDINSLFFNIVEVTEKYGLKLPKDFLLLFKQILYFDYYLSILAPDVEIIDYAQEELFLK